MVTQMGELRGTRVFNIRALPWRGARKLGHGLFLSGRLHDASSLRFEASCTSLARTPTTTINLVRTMPESSLAPYQKIPPVPCQPANLPPSRSLLARAAVSLRGRGNDAWRESSPEGLHYGSPLLDDEASLVSTCCFLSSPRITNSSKQHEPTVLLSKIQQPSRVSADIRFLKRPRHEPDRAPRRG
jgi:hypothetical protein